MSSRKRKREEDDLSGPASSSEDSKGSKTADRPKKSRRKQKKKKKERSKEKRRKHKKKKKKRKKGRRRRGSDTESEEDVNVDEKQPVYKTERVGAPKLISQDNLGMCEKTIIRLGTGRRPVRGQEVTLHCQGYLLKTKKKFWDTRELKTGGHKPKPFTFRVGVGKVIKGWDIGVLAMRLGERARLVMTGSFGYGMRGNLRWGIPPHCDLEFDMEVLSISDTVVLPDKYELMRQKVAQSHTFLERDGRATSALKFNSAPF